MRHVNVSIVSDSGPGGGFIFIIDVLKPCSTFEW